jgi:hypothetical protein
MDAFKCDRCGNMELGKPTELGGTTVRSFRFDRNDTSWLRDQPLELCPKCIASLEAWLKNEPANTASTRQGRAVVKKVK